jgi:hypothetical protein
MLRSWHPKRRHTLSDSKGQADHWSSRCPFIASDGASVTLGITAALDQYPALRNAYGSAVRSGQGCPCPACLSLAVRPEGANHQLEEFSLSLHPDKTRLIEFGRHAATRRAQRGLGKPETFKFLGFVFICGRSRKGKFLLKRKSRRDRMRAKLEEIKKELRRRMHQAIPEQGRWLAQVIRGYFAYHGVPTNSAALSAFRYHAERLWLRTLRRRSQKDRFSWERMIRLANDFLPQPRILHPWPSVRFAVTTQGGSRMP